MPIYATLSEALQFHLRVIGDLPKLLASETFSHIEEDMAAVMLDHAARFSAEHLETLAVSGDRQGCRIEDGRVKLPAGTREAYQAWCGLGFPLVALPLEQDGMAFPAVLQSALQELGDSANLAFGMLCINLRCAVKALQSAASEEQLAQWLPALAAGELTTTIVISEPQAGSDVGRINSLASPGNDGNWQLTGNKIWISYGDHDASDNILHLVLARTPDAQPGTRGLSLFAVPRDAGDDNNGITVGRLEEKMGLHASPTCVLSFEDSSATLIGREGEGIKNLFTMMNAMRLAVAVQGSAIANASTLHAINYALERPQGGRPDQPAMMISEHADVRRMLLDMSARAELLRALSLRVASALDQADSATDPEEAETWRRQAELMLPIAKTLGAEWGFEVANQGIQVLGGSGYTSDYPLERMARDIRVGSIYEGTSGIQALDFLRRKLLADKLTAMHQLMDRIHKTLPAASDDNPLAVPLLSILEQVQSTLDHLLEATQEDKAAADAGAYPLLRLCGLLLCAWNGFELWQAANTDSPWQRRLRAAMTRFSVGLSSEAQAWAEKALAKEDDYRIEAQ